MDIFIVSWRTFSGELGDETLSSSGIYGASLLESSALALADRMSSRIADTGYYNDATTIPVGLGAPPPMDVSFPGSIIYWTVFKGKESVDGRKPISAVKAYLYVTKTKALDSPLEILAAQAE